MRDRAPAVGGPVRFGPQVVLTKEEVFGACQALADAGRALVRSGGGAEADTLCSLFALLEERLVADRPEPGAGHPVRARIRPRPGGGSGADRGVGGNVVP